MLVMKVIRQRTLNKVLEIKRLEKIQPINNKELSVGYQQYVTYFASVVLYCCYLVVKSRPTLWPPDAKSWLIWKDPDAGKDWGQEEKGMTRDEMVGWHHWLHGHELSKLWELVIDREAWPAAVHGVAKSQTQLSNWTELGNIELKSWGITPLLLGLLNSIYMTISTAGGWGKRSLPHCWWDVCMATL